MNEALMKDRRRQALAAINRGRREAKPLYEITAHQALFEPEIRPSLNRLIACQPKSASTFAANVISEVLSIPKVTYSTYGAGPLETSIDRIKELSETHAVVHQHCIAHRRDLGLFRAAGLRPVVIVRDIADSLVSYCDHRSQKSDGLARDKAFSELSFDDQIVTTAIERAHWFFMFQATWFSAIKFNHIPAIMIDYEDLTQHPEWAISQMLEHWGESASHEKISESLIQNYVELL